MLAGLVLEPAGIWLDVLFHYTVRVAISIAFINNNNNNNNSNNN